MINKRVANAKEVTYDGISFKSQLEVRLYRQLKEVYQVSFDYEPQSFDVLDSVEPTVPFIIKDTFKRLNKNLIPVGEAAVLDKRKISGVRYTPDFIVYAKDKIIIIEAKGFATGEFMYRFKLFRMMMEEIPEKEKYEIWEVFSIAQLRDCMARIGVEPKVEIAPSVQKGRRRSNKTKLIKT